MRWRKGVIGASPKVETITCQIRAGWGSTFENDSRASRAQVESSLSSSPPDREGGTRNRVSAEALPAAGFATELNLHRAARETQHRALVAAERFSSTIDWIASSA
jgi:hypothetical protein